jgi:hypothetical protein
MVMHKILKHSDADLNDFELEENFKDIIFRAAHPNPFERYTIDELIENFEEKMMPYKTSTPTITVESVDSVSVNSDSNHKQKEDCMKNTLPVLRKIVDAHKMPKKFKTLRKSELCGKVKHIINGNNGNVGISQIKSSVEECMKKKKPELVKIVEEKKLPKKLKMMKKEDICKVINENESKKGSNSSYRTAVQPANNGNSVSFDDCMNYYSLKELKDLVDKNNLPRKLKQLNKGELCRSVYEILRQKTVKAIVRRGPKAKK